VSGLTESEAEGDGEPSAPEPGASPAPRTAKGKSERSELGKRAQSSARRVAESKATVPHIYLGRTAVLGAAGGGGAAVVIGALGHTLGRHRGLNGAYRDGAIETHSRINIGITVETGDGPLVPTLLDADKKSVDEIATEIEELRAGAVAGTLPSPAYSGATFTLTLLPEGADSVLAPVTPGQAAHLAVGRLRQAVVVGATDAPEVTDVVDLGLSCDARAVRPVVAAEFLDSLAALIGDSAG
jgi:pyruvate dehydrogenase E2 component (dihydrolipoamide acetyltransferase)